MPTADVDLIRQLFSRWFDAMEAGDVDTCAELVTDDVMSKPPSGVTTVGRDALRERLRAFHEFASEQVHHQVVEVDVRGDLAYAWINETVMVTPRDGAEPVSVSGVHLAILRRTTEGLWLIASEVACTE